MYAEIEPAEESQTEDELLDDGAVTTPIDFSGWIISAGIYRRGDSDDWVLIPEGGLVEHNEAVRMEIAYKVPEDVQIKAGDVIRYELPGSLAIASEQSGDVYSAGTDVGDYKIYEDITKTIIEITFTQDDIHSGTISFQGDLHLNETTQSNQKETIHIGDVTLVVEVKPSEKIETRNVMIYKIISDWITDSDGGSNVNRIQYRIQVRNSGTSTVNLKNLVVWDQFETCGEYVSYDTTAGSNGNGVQINTQYTSASLIEDNVSITPEFDNVNKKAKFTINGEIPPNKDLYFYYWVTIDEDFYLDNDDTEQNVVTRTLKNKATVTGDVDQPKAATAMYSAYNVPVSKAAWMQPDGTIMYQVYVNRSTPVIDIKEGEWVVTDTLGEGQEIVGKVEAICSGTEWNLVGSRTYDLNSTSAEFEMTDATKGFKWYVPAGPYRWVLKYYVKVTDKEDNKLYSNSVNLEKEVDVKKRYKSNTSIHYATYQISKNVDDAGIDIGDGTLGWRVKISSSLNDGKFLAGTYVEDVLSAEKGTHTFDPDVTDLKVCTNVNGNDPDSYTLLPASDYTVSYGEDEKTLKVTFVNDVQGPIWLLYRSKASLGKESSKENLVENYSNCAQLHAGSNCYASSQTYPYSMYFVMEKEAGEYDQVNRTLTWDIILNKERVDLTNLKISADNPLTVTDVLPEGMEFVSGELYRLDGSEWKLNDQITGTVTAGQDKRTVTANITSVRNKTVFKVHLVTKVTAKISSMEGTKFSNTAKVKVGDDPIGTTTEDVTIKSDPLTKEGVYSESTAPYVEYTLRVNPEGEMWGDEDTITLSDTMNNEMRLLATSLNVVNADTGAPVEYRFINAPERLGFDLVLPNATPIVITYKVYVYGAVRDNVQISNTAKITAASRIMATEWDNQEIRIKSSNATAEVGLAFYIYKKNVNTGEALEGAEFEIGYAEIAEQDGTKTAKIPEDTANSGFKTAQTDENGRIIVNRADRLEANRWYYFRETKAPDGYVLDPTTYFFLIPDGSKKNEAVSNGHIVQNGYAFEIYNDNASLIVEKAVTGTDAKDAYFDVTVTGWVKGESSEAYTEADLRGALVTGLAAGKTAEIVGNKITFQVRKGSKISIENIPVGKYEVVETAADGYTTSYESVVNEMKSDTGTVILSASAKEKDGTVRITNDYDAKGSCELKGTKRVENGTLQDGFVFGLYEGELSSPAKEGWNEAENSTARTSKNKVVNQGAAFAFDLHFTMEDMAIYDDADKTEITGYAASREFTFYVKEEAVPDGLDSYVNEQGTYYRLVYTVTDDGAGNLVPELTGLYKYTAAKDRTGEVTETDLTGKQTTADFVNVYSAAGSLTLSAEKVLEGAALKEGQFSFILKDEKGNVLQTKTNDKDGKVTFDALKYTEQDINKEYVYTVAEVKGQEAGIIYDETVYTVKAAVTDNEDGTLQVTAKLRKESGEKAEADTMVFRNVFTADAVLIVTKQLTYQGSPLTAQDAVFYVALFEDEACTKRVSDIKAIVFKNASASSVTFTGLARGTKYYVAETDASGNVITSGKFAEDGVFQVNFAKGNCAVMENADGTKTITFENQVLELPSGYYKEDQPPETETEVETEVETEIEMESETEEETETEKAKETEKSESAKTGDETPIVPYAACLMLSAVVVLVLVTRRRKNERA